MPNTVDLVLSAEYFPHVDEQKHPLEIVMGNQAVRDCVSGIWVPGYLTHDHDVMSELVGISSGNRFVEYEFTAPLSPYEASETVRAKATEELHSTQLIIDACIDGGTSDVVHQVEQLVGDYRAKDMIITLSPSIRDVGINGLKSVFENENGIGYYMVATYPEDNKKGVRKFTGMEESVFTKHVANITREYDLQGVAGFAGLAQETLDDQELLAMGVTNDGKNYLSPVTTRYMHKDKTGEVYKRARTPERALAGATFDETGRCNTRLLLGRAVTVTNGDIIEIPEGIIWESDRGKEITDHMIENILHIHDQAVSAITL